MARAHITTSEAAALLNLSPGRVRQFVCEGRLRAERTGAVNLVLRADVLRLAKAREKSSANGLAIA